MLAETVAVITGGASGIGREIALTFAEYGADVIIADIREHPRNADTPTHEVIRKTTESRAKFVQCDVTDIKDIRQAVAAANEYGGITVMVNNAAIAMEEELFELTEQEYDTIMDINVKGVYFGSKFAAEQMIENDGGSIINISSIAGIRGTGSLIAYSASKGAVRLMTYALADRLGADGIRVNALHPGTIQTAMSDDIGVSGSDRGNQYKETTPLRRLGEPADVANAAVFLASDLSEFVTGASIPVDGGRTYTY